MRIDVVTLFPSFFRFDGLVGKAIDSGLARVECIDPRAYTHDVHRTVDDAPYGGGAGMVMKPEPLAQAIREAKAHGGGPVVVMSPQGRRLSQRDLLRWVAHEHLVLVCGRYEGFDERVLALCDEEISLGDFVLTGGEYAALAIMDGVIRLLPGTLGNASSSVTDSFTDGLLEHPQYTRPQIFEGRDVPEILRSGDHAKVEAWRRRESLLRTLSRRPDLFVERGVSEEERASIGERPKPAIALVVATKDREVAFDVARLAASYRIEARIIGEVSVEGLPIEVVRPKEKKKRRGPPPTIDAGSVCKPFDPDENLGVKVAVGREGEAPIVGPKAVPRPMALLVGPTGLTPALRLPPFRGASEAQDLPAVAAAAIALDRVLGEGD
jgi:tRNA (guanine37-N1)-methyltransferase